MRALDSVAWSDFNECCPVLGLGAAAVVAAQQHVWRRAKEAAGNGLFVSGLALLGAEGLSTCGGQVTLDDVVVGQYRSRTTSGKTLPGYLDDATVPAGRCACRRLSGAVPLPCGGAEGGGGSRQGGASAGTWSKGHQAP